MELIVQVRTHEALEAALEAGVGGVARRLPRRPQPPWWLEAEGWRVAAGRRGVNFYLIWDWLAPEKDLPGAEQILAAISRINPNALLIRDMGLFREARRRLPDLQLQAAGNWGCHNSPALHLAEALGFSRVVVDSELGLKNLALIRRQARVPLVVALPNLCPGLASLCLLEEFLGIDCNACLGLLAQGEELPGISPAALETLSGLSQLDVEAIQVGGEFSDGESLHLIVELCQAVWRASPGNRPQVLAAAR
jgi:putative protease